MASASASRWWDEVNAIGRYSARGGAQRWKCRYCGAEKNGGTSRVRAHLLGERGHGINECPSIPHDKKASLLAFAQTLDAPRPVRPLAPEARFVPSSSSSAGGGSTPLPSVGPSAAPLQPPHSSGRQATLAATWHPGRRALVDCAVARYFYSSGVSFNSVRSPYFREMVQEIARFGPSYEPPSYDALRNRILQQEKASIENALEPIREGWLKHGVTLIGDGWSDARSRSIHGIIAYSRGVSYFVSAIDNSQQGKTAERLADIWSEAIEFVGPANVLQFIGDGEPANRAAGAIIEARYPHICFSPCIAHCLNNLLKDIGKLPYFLPVIEMGREVVTFITRHHQVLALYHNVCNKDLLKYSDTRFAYNFIMLERLQEMKISLRQLVVSREWLLCSNTNSATARRCVQTVLDEGFWEQVHHLLEVVQPIIRMLRLVDGDAPCIGKVYEGLDKMVEHIERVETDADRFEDLRELCQGRWDSYHSTLQAAAFVLDPEFQGKGQESDGEVTRGWERTLQRLIPDVSKRRTVKDQLAFYRTKQGLFSFADALRDRFVVGSALWWEDYGADTPELQRFAIRILSQGASSSPCERLWSSYSHIASKKRNRLSTQKANDLVFVNANLRLLNKQAEGFTEERYVGFASHSEDSSGGDGGDSGESQAAPQEDDVDATLASLVYP